MRDRYHRTSIALHWLMAAGLLGAFALGMYMHELPLSPGKLKLYAWHKWAGVTLFMLALARIGWRAGHPAPALPPTMSATSRRLAMAGHGALYLLMLVIPLSGWLMSSAKGFQTVWFGLIPLPDLINKSDGLGESLAALHKGLNLSLAALVLGHVGAALKHHWLDRDGVLQRMLP